MRRLRRGAHLAAALDGSFDGETQRYDLWEPEKQCKRFVTLNVDPVLLVRAGVALCSRTAALHVAINVVAETGSTQLFDIIMKKIAQLEEHSDQALRYQLALVLYWTDNEGRCPLDMAIIICPP